MKRNLFSLLSLVACFSVAFALQGTAPFGRILLSIGLPQFALPLLTDVGWRGRALYKAGKYQQAADVFWSGGEPYSFQRGDALARAGKLRPALEAFETELADHPGNEAAAANKTLLSSLIFSDQSPKDSGFSDGGAATKEKSTHPEDNPGHSEDNKTNANGLGGSQESSTKSANGGGSKIKRKGNADKDSTSSGESKNTGSLDDSDGIGKAAITEAVIAAQLKKVSLRRLGKSFEASEASATQQWLTTLIDDPGHYLKMILKAEHAQRVQDGISVPDGEDP